MATPDPKLMTGGADPVLPIAATADAREPWQLPDELFEASRQAFQDLNCKLVKADLETPIGLKIHYYKAEAHLGDIVLIHAPTDLINEPMRLMVQVYWFLGVSLALFIFSVDSESLSPAIEGLITNWRNAHPNLRRANIFVRPQLQALSVDAGQMCKGIKELLELDQLIGFTDKLSDDDRMKIVDLIAEQAASAPGLPRDYFRELVQQLGLERKQEYSFLSILNGNPGYDADNLVQWVENRIYQDGKKPGYKTVLACLLEKLAYNGGGKEMVDIIEKYGLITDEATFRGLRVRFQ